MYLQDMSQERISTGDSYHINASSVLPASKKRSAITLNNLPCDDAAPMALNRFRTVGTPSEEFRFMAGATLDSADLEISG